MSVANKGIKADNQISRAAMMMPVYVPTFLLSFAQGMLIPILPIFAKGFGVSFSLASLAVAAAGIGTLVADVPVGMVLAQIGRRRAMFIGIFLAATTTLIIPIAHSFPILIMCRLVEGVGTALWGLSRHAYITDIAPRAQRGKFIASFGGINRAGTFAGPILGGTLADWFGLTAPYYLAAGMTAFAGILAFSYIKETGSRAGVATRGHMRWRSVGKLMRTHRADLGSAGAAQIFVAMIRSGRQLIIPLYGAYAVGLSSGQIGTILTAAATIDMALFIPAGWLMDRFGRKVASVPSFAIMAVGMLVHPVRARLPRAPLGGGDYRLRQRHRLRLDDDPRRGPRPARCHRRVPRRLAVYRRCGIGGRAARRRHHRGRARPRRDRLRPLGHRHRRRRHPLRARPRDVAGARGRA